MRCLLLAAVALALSLPAKAAVVGDLGVNPSSAEGDFSGSPGGGAFSDQFTFQLLGAPQYITVGSVTNVFPNTTDFITNFQASVYLIVNGIGGADDVAVIGPTDAVACPIVPDCQFAAGTAILDAGSYYLQFTGIGGGTSGYGGNLSTFGVPGPALGAGLPALLAALGMLGFNWLRRRA